MLFLYSCEDVIEVDVPTAPPKLVIDANFEVYFNEDPVSTEGGIRLTTTAPFFDDDVPTVSGATVFITDLSDDTIITFTESTEPGLYTASSPFNPQLGVAYELTVIYQGDTYIATASRIPAVPIDNVEEGDGTLFGGDEKEVIVSFTDDGSRRDYYLFDFDFNLYLPIEDEFFQGEAFNFSYFYEDTIDNRVVTIKILGVDEQYFNYFSILNEQSGQEGDPFQAPPSELRGNIINTTTPAKYPLGYFNISETDRFEITLTE
ncbi:uncharacterized protein DUF4249 [Aquimarina brevivitae]|uniref:Uncharacterized protein DUF4249 n=2 Tax=Aquimarina brevivitae TaxID=323412 RepID=A0A4Q7P001_9FLAO|nr:uncharacterized protein DUF4249 [Aquimarina brevivitae]